MPAQSFSSAALNDYQSSINMAEFDYQMIVAEVRQPAKGAIEAERRPRVRPARHEWQKIRLGRVCGVCMVAQVSGEFDDAVPCQPRHAA